MEGGRAGGGGGLAAHRRDAGQAQPVGDLGGDVGAVLELLAVHDADLDGVEGAHRGVLQGTVVGFREEIEHAGEDAAGEVDLGETDRGDVYLPGHRRPG